MHILMVNCEYPPIGGGAAQAHQHLLNEYSRIDDLYVDVLTAGLEPQMQREQFSQRIAVYKVPLQKKNLHYWRKSEVICWLYKAQRQYRRLLQTNSYDLAHAFFAFPSAYLCYRSADRLPYVISLRGSDVPGYNVRLGLDYWLLAGLFRRIWNRSSALVANSFGLRDLALRFTPALDIRVIPNGVDTKIFYPAERRLLPRPLRALTVCRLIRRKRLDLLIQAAARAQVLGVPLTLTIAGEGNLRQELQRQAELLGAANHISFLGRVPPERMPQLYRDHDLFLMSSAHEGMSNAMLEAMASGLPIITTPCEGVEELIAENGIVVDADAESLAQAIKRLSSNENDYLAMCVAAQRQAQKFRWPTVANQYAAIYYQIILKKERSGDFS